MNTDKLKLPWEENRHRIPRPMKVLYWVLGIAVLVLIFANQCGG